jgi:hypothetical protein
MSSYAPLNKTALRRPVEPGQYLAIRYTERLAEVGVTNSVGSKGDSFDNAMAESIIGLYKTDSSATADPGEASTTSSSPPSNGSTGSTTGDCFMSSGESHPPSSRTATTVRTSHPTRERHTPPSLRETRGGSVREPADQDPRTLRAHAQRPPTSSIRQRWRCIRWTLDRRSPRRQERNRDISGHPRSVLQPVHRRSL